MIIALIDACNRRWEAVMDGLNSAIVWQYKAVKITVNTVRYSAEAAIEAFYAKTEKYGLEPERYVHPISDDTYVGISLDTKLMLYTSWNLGWFHGYSESKYHKRVLLAAPEYTYPMMDDKRVYYVIGKLTPDVRTQFLNDCIVSVKEQIKAVNREIEFVFKDEDEREKCNAFYAGKRKLEYFRMLLFYHLGIGEFQPCLEYSKEITVETLHDLRCLHNGYREIALLLCANTGHMQTNAFRGFESIPETYVSRISSVSGVYKKVFAFAKTVDYEDTDMVLTKINNDLYFSTVREYKELIKPYLSDERSHAKYKHLKATDSIPENERAEYEAFDLHYGDSDTPTLPMCAADMNVANDMDKACRWIERPDYAGAENCGTHVEPIFGTNGRLKQLYSGLSRDVYAERITMTRITNSTKILLDDANKLDSRNFKAKCVLCGTEMRITDGHCPSCGLTNILATDYKQVSCSLFRTAKFINLESCLTILVETYHEPTRHDNPEVQKLLNAIAVEREVVDLFDVFDYDDFVILYNNFNMTPWSRKTLQKALEDYRGHGKSSEVIYESDIDQNQFRHYTGDELIDENDHEYNMSLYEDDQYYEADGIVQDDQYNETNDRTLSETDDLVQDDDEDEEE